MKTRIDLTEGPVLRQLIVFFLPIAAGIFFQQLYTAIDALVVSRYIGITALGAVGGSTARIGDALIGFCVSLSNGAAVVVSHLYGEKRYGDTKKAIQTAYIFCVLLGLVITVLVVMLTPELLALLKTPLEIVPLATQYQRVVFIGALFILIYNMGSSVLRALGDSRFPFFCLMLSCILNSGLDVLFVVKFQMGVIGAAWATVLSEAISAILVTVKLLRAEEWIRLSLHNMRIDYGILRRIMRIGIPSGLQSSMYSISNLVLQIGINELGTLVVAAWTMTGNVDGIFWGISGAFSSAVCAFVGQNYGAKKMSRVRECTRRGLILFLFITVGMCGVILIFSRQILQLFTPDPEVISCTRYIINFFLPLYFLWSAIDVLSGAMRGIGDTLIPMVVTVISICLFRILWVSTVFAHFQTLTVICLCYPISWLLGDIGIIVHYRNMPIFRNTNDK